MSLTKKRILIIDDDISLAHLVKLNLEATNQYEVRAECHAPHAIQTARLFSPDLILLDYIMPELNGAEVTAQLHADPDLCHIPVVMVTATVSNAEMKGKGTMEHRGQVTVAKPMGIERLRRCIEKQLFGYCYLPLLHHALSDDTTFHALEVQGLKQKRLSIFAGAEIQGSATFEIKNADIPQRKVVVAVHFDADATMEQVAPGVTARADAGQSPDSAPSRTLYLTRKGLEMLEPPRLPEHPCTLHLPVETGI